MIARAGLCAFVAVAACGCAPDLVIETHPRPPESAVVVDPRTGDALTVDMVLQQSARAVQGCATVVEVSQGSTITGTRCENAPRAILDGSIALSVDLPALPFGAVVTIAVTARDFEGEDSTALLVTGRVDRDPPALASFTASEAVDGSVSLAWTLAEVPFGTSTVHVLRDDDAPPETLDAAGAVVVFDGPATTGVAADPARQFSDGAHYAAFALDAKGVASSPVFASTGP